MTASKEITGADQVQVYNLDSAKTPGGMKVRWRVRIATGKEAERLEKLQSQGIIKLLAWADQYLRQQEENSPDPAENTDDMSRRQREMSP